MYIGINCSNPKYIVSPTLRSDVMHCDYLLHHDRVYRVNAEQRYAYLSGESLNKVFNLPYIDLSLLPIRDRQHVINTWSFCDSNTGEVYPIYQEVACGHCELCIQRKIYSYVQRASFHAEETKLMSWFITLTYNDKHLPSFGVDKRSLQLFKKRFKRNYELYHEQLGHTGCTSKLLKFIISSEYTPTTHRPHYHVLVFGMQPFFADTITNRYEVTHFVQYIWRDVERFGSKYKNYATYKSEYPQIFDRSKDYDPFSYGYCNVVPARTADAVKYILKYSFKQYDKSQNAPSDKMPNFRLCSTNLGLQFVQQFKPELLKSLDGSFTYASVFDGSVHTAKLCNYYIKKLFPSWSTLIPCSLRRAYLNAAYAAQTLCDTPFVPKDIKHAAVAAKLYINQEFPFLELLELKYPSDAKPLQDFAFISDNIELLSRSIDELQNYNLDLSDIKEKCWERITYLSFFRPLGDVTQNAFRAKQNLTSLQTKVKLI